MDAISNVKEMPFSSEGEWRTISEAALKIGSVRSIDILLHQALDAWLEQAAPQLRWEIALELYTTEQMSLGRAAEIAGLNYFVFLERLRDKNIALVEADVTSEPLEEQQKALIHDVFRFTSS